MKFSEIARNLINEGMKYKWGKERLVKGYHKTDSSDTDFSFCALGIKAREGGVPPVTLAYFDNRHSPAIEETVREYSDFTGLHLVFYANDDSRLLTREAVSERLNTLDGEVDIEGFIKYLHTLTPRAIEWATEMGYKSLLVGLEGQSNV